MIPVRQTPLHGPIEYFLDCAQEAGEMDSCTAMTLRLYSDNEALHWMEEPVTNTVPDRSHFRVRRAKCLEYAALAEGILPRLTPMRQAGLVRVGLFHVVEQLLGLAEIMACWTVEDEIEGGMMLPFRRKLRSKNGVPFKRIARRLRSPKYIRDYVKNNAPEHAEHLLALSQLMISRARKYGAKHDPEVLRDYRIQLDQRVAADRLSQLRSEVLPAIDLKAQRKLIRRSLSTAISICGPDMVSAFLRGEEIRLLGNEAMLVLKKRGSLTALGHGALSVGLADRNGVRLADLCTFIENTPTLDQLSGFALWMKNGGEGEVLKTANVVSVEDAGRDHPLLNRRRGDQVQEALTGLTRLLGVDRADEIMELIGNDRAHRRRLPPEQLNSEQRRERNQKYWEETKGEWIEALVAFVIGYRNLPLFKSAGVL